MVAAITVFPPESTLVALVVALLGMTEELLELMCAVDEKMLVGEAELLVVVVVGVVLLLLLLPLLLSSLLLTTEAAEVEETVWLDVCEAIDTVGVVMASDAAEVAPPTVEVVVYVM